MSGEIIEAFRESALNAGVALPAVIVADGKGHRFDIGRKAKRGFYVLHLDGNPAGAYQDWALHQEPIRWKFQSSENKVYTAEERREYAENRRLAEQKQAAEQIAQHQNAAVEAQRIWNAAQPAPNSHPYLVKKRIQPHAARLHNGALVLPLYDASSRLMSLQFIGFDGQKRFLKGGKKRGCFFVLGKQTDKVLLCEGFATGASLHESSGLHTFISFDSSNLEPVARVIRAKKPQAVLIVCGDNDLSGKGQEQAERAAYAVNGLVSIPPIAGSDFNDWLNGEAAHDNCNL